MKRGGWHFEGWRHSMASRGIKTAPPGYRSGHRVNVMSVGTAALNVTPNAELTVMRTADKDVTKLNDLKCGLEDDQRAIAKRRYRVDYKRAADNLKMVFHDGSPEVHGTDMKELVVDDVRNEVRGELDEGVKRGDMRFQDAQAFMDDDFTKETKHFVQSTNADGQAYRREVRRRLDRHKSMYSKRIELM
jgi:hypothetical protein